MVVPHSTEAHLEEIVRSPSWLTRALEAACTVDSPDWVIGSGAVRTAVWDHLHGYEKRTELADIDLVFFDPDDLSEAREHDIQSRLQSALPDEPWDAKNQAAVHIWYPEKFGYEVHALTSSAAAVTT